ncbi:unnamed protein product [Diplocarpon coronariae]
MKLGLKKARNTEHGLQAPISRSQKWRCFVGHEPAEDFSPKNMSPYKVHPIISSLSCASEGRREPLTQQ